MSTTLSILLSVTLFSQSDGDLHTELFKLDSLLFEESFNQCNLIVADTLISSDLEFYHDQGGFQDKADFMKAVKENICASADQKPIRKAISDSFEVFPLYSVGELYGAIQNGQHQFFISEENGRTYLTSTALFSHLWILEAGQWKLKRVYSYDHRSPEEPSEND